MNMHEKERYYWMIRALQIAGITYADAEALRRISLTLRRWHELKCGTGNGYVERNEKTGAPYWFNSQTHYLDPHDPRAGSRIPDREAGAIKRLAVIMMQYPTLQSYIQTDPRGAALYIIRPGDVPEGANVESCYNRGICVY